MLTQYNNHLSEKQENLENLLYACKNIESVISQTKPHSDHKQKNLRFLDVISKTVVDILQNLIINFNPATQVLIHFLKNCFLAFCDHAKSAKTEKPKQSELELDSMLHKLQDDYIKFELKKIQDEYAQKIVATPDSHLLDHESLPLTGLVCAATA